MSFEGVHVPIPDQDSNSDLGFLRTADGANVLSGDSEGEKISDEGFKEKEIEQTEDEQFITFGDGGILEIAKDGFKLKYKNEGILFSTEPDFDENVKLKVSYHSEVVDEKEVEFGNFGIIKSLSIAAREAELTSGKSHFEAVSLKITSRDTMEGIDEKTLTFGWVQGQQNAERIEAALGKVMGNFNEAGYSQDFGHLGYKRMIGDLLYYSSFSFTTAAELGTLSDGTVLMFGSDNEPVAVQEGRVDSKTLLGLRFGIKQQIAEKEAQMEYSCNVMRRFGENFPECKISFEQLRDNRQFLYGIQFTSDGASKQELELKVGQFFDDFIFGKFDLQYTLELSHDIGDGGVSGKIRLKAAYWKKGKEGFDSFKNSITHSAFVSSDSRNQEY